jgi:hypothetical protein
MAAVLVGCSGQREGQSLSRPATSVLIGKDTTSTVTPSTAVSTLATPATTQAAVVADSSSSDVSAGGGGSSMSVDPATVSLGATFQVEFSGPALASHAAFYVLINEQDEGVSVLWSDKFVEPGVVSPGFSFDVSSFPILDFPVRDGLPDSLVLPDSIPLGRYRVCMASSALEYCDELEVIP